MLRQVTCQICSIPLKKSFSISRGTKTTADVIRLEIKQGEILGRAESVPYARRKLPVRPSANCSVN